MKQRVIIAKPPVYDRCVHAFGAAVIVGKPIIWSWGDVIYNPTNIDIARELVVHEGVHGARQLAAGVERWWDQYLLNRDFRFSEEVAAHQAEWQNLVKWHKHSAAALEAISGRLASPLYGSMVDLNAARTNVLLHV
jgi:hypothetical protein